MRRERILIVGRAHDCEALAELLMLHGFAVAIAAAERLVGTARAWAPDVVVADAEVPDLDGRAVVDALASLHPRPRTVLVTPRPSRALAARGVACVPKPVDLGALLRAIGSPELAA